MHLGYFLDLAEKANRELRGTNQIEWLSRLTVTRDNLRAAQEWAIETKQTEIALQMARKLDWFWFMHSDHNEGRQWLQRVLEMPDIPLYSAAQAQALTQLAHHTWVQIGEKEARPYAEQALSIAHTHADKHNTARGLAILGLILADEKNFAAAQSTLEESMALYQQVHDGWGYAHAILCLGQISYFQGDHAKSLAVHEEALVNFQELGDRFFESVAHRIIGILRLRQGDLTGGVAALREALVLAQQLDAKIEIAYGLRYIANAAETEGTPARAVRLYWASRNVLASIGVWRQENDRKFENNLASCSAVLSESEFAKAVKQGRAMTMEQAIAYALEGHAY